MSATERTKQTHDLFRDDLDSYPENYFSSPIKMYEYEDWASDSDDDSEEIEWDAGITDFALFDSDRRRAQESNERLPSTWNNMLENQTSALQRSVDRKRVNSTPDQMSRPLLNADDVPSLTPDNSPSLRDDLDVESYHGQNEARPSVPHYLTINVEPPEGQQDDKAREDDEEAPLFISVKNEQSQTQARRKRERPGLRHSRTMSGQVHAWRRPSMNMYTLGEEPDAERREELCTIRRIDSG